MKPRKKEENKIGNYTSWHNIFKAYLIKDILLCSILVSVCAAVTFLNIGATDFPQTSYSSSEPIFIDFGRMVNFNGVLFLNGGNRHAEGFKIYSWDGDDETDLIREVNLYSRSGEDIELIHEEMQVNWYYWLPFRFEVATRYVIIEPDTTGIEILEMAFFDNYGYVGPVVYYPSEAALIFDEPELIPEAPSNMLVMSFDESLFALTAYEFIHAKRPYEVTHPPLGKSIIALGINIFGMTPFGWRFMSALFGVIMIIPIYVLSKRMFGSWILAFLVAFTFTFDFMRFAQTRVANIDTFLVMFIICTYLFMYEYTRISPENRLTLKSLIYLGFSGAFMGLAISIKWSGVFAGLGLGVLFTLAWVKSRAHYASSKMKGLFLKDFNKTVIYCLLFFIVVPVVIYCLSYIPFVRVSDLSWFESIISSQVDMLSFHTNFAGSNDYQSRWWTWPLNLRSVLYSRFHLPDGKIMGIHSFGNPALWWGGLLTLAWCVKYWIAEKDKIAQFLCIAWIAQILPWAFVSRFSFIYHYFPCVPFLALMIAYFIKNREPRHQKWYVAGYCILVLILFVMFYPVLNGVIAANKDYVRLLEWLPGWHFIGMDY